MPLPRDCPLLRGDLAEAGAMPIVGRKGKSLWRNGKHGKPGRAWGENEEMFFRQARKVCAVCQQFIKSIRMD